MSKIMLKSTTILLVLIGVFFTKAQAQGDCTCPKVTFDHSTISDPGPNSYKVSLYWRAPEGDRKSEI